MKIFDHLDKMYEDICENDWDEVETKYREFALKWAGKEIVKEIDAVDLDDYEKSIMQILSEAVETAEKTSAGAIYFEYDMDNNWQGHFYICPEYYLEEEEDEDWVTESDEDIEGPDLPAYADIYNEFGGAGGDKTEIGTTIYLIARTVCAFWRCVEQLPSTPALAICIGYHGQDQIWRIREIEEQ